MSRASKLFVISGPSGVGKGTICKKLLKKLDSAALSISMTTRPSRRGEKDGVNYFFVSKEGFKKAIETDLLLEYAEVYGNYYGTPKSYVFSQLEEGKDVILEIDVQGALNVKKNYEDSVLIFIMPPSINELENRIRKRGKDSEEIIKKRMACARAEIDLKGKYDFVVVNSHLGIAVDEILSIMNDIS